MHSWLRTQQESLRKLLMKIHSMPEQKAVSKSPFNPLSFHTSVAQEVFTDADVQVQATIFKGLKNFWPALNIIGKQK